MSDEISVVVDDVFDVANVGNGSVIAHTHPLAQISDMTPSARAFAAAASTAEQLAAISLHGSVAAYKNFTTVSALLADAVLSYATGGNGVTAGDYLSVSDGIYIYQVQASDAISYHLTTVGGVKLNVLPGPSGYNVKAFGAKGDGLTNDASAIQAAVSAGYRAYFPAGEYIVNTGIELPDSIQVYGEGYKSKITSTGTNTRIFYADSKTGIIISNLFLNGNLTGDGSLLTGAAGGEAVFLRTCTNCIVRECFFDNIGKAAYAATFAGCVTFYASNYCTASGNIFLSNNCSRTGADIVFTYFCSNISVTGNISYSEHDSFISGAAVGLTELDTCHHVISNNIGYRSDASDARHGILMPYSKSAFATISNNVMVNFPANGIYVAGAADAGETVTSVSVTGNVIRFCGGDSNMTGISAGIYLSGRGGVACTGNLVAKSGYTSAGTTRNNAVPGIRLTNYSRAITVTGNTVVSSYGYGVELTNSGNVAMEALVIADNALLDNVSGGILISASNASSTITDVQITGNNIKQTSNDANGITITQSSGATITGPLHIVGNSIVGIASSTSYGISSSASGMVNWSIRSNSIKNFTRGLSFGSASVADKEIGYNCIISENTLDTCVTGVWANIGATKYAFVFGTTYISCTSNVADPARILNCLRQSDTIVHAYRSAAPTDGAWLVGQRIVRNPPAVGSPKAWVCTVAGSPGTWTSEGNL